MVISRPLSEYIIFKYFLFQFLKSLNKRIVKLHTTRINCSQKVIVPCYYQRDNEDFDSTSGNIQKYRFYKQ